MAVNAPVAHAPASRSGKRSKLTPVEAGLPDPRPVTDYSTAYEEIDDKSQITVTLSQPCVIREPRWGFVNCFDGGSVFADAVEVKNNVTIVFYFSGIIAPTVGFVDVPYQDMQVQNFQGGFVRSGGQWFRKPE